MDRCKSNIYQIHFQFSDPFQARLAYKFTKSDKMTPKVFFPNIFNTEFKGIPEYAP